MKRLFEQPELETIILLNADIITTSDDNGDVSQGQFPNE